MSEHQFAGVEPPLRPYRGHRWRIYRDPGSISRFPWVVECPRLFEVAPHRHTRHRQFCSLCDVFPSWRSARVWVSSQVEAGNPRPFGHVLAGAGAR